jgi:hypothetical protein
MRLVGSATFTATRNGKENVGSDPETGSVSCFCLPLTVVELFSRQVMKCLLHRTRYVPSMSQVQARAYGALITRFVAATLASLVARGRH